MGLTRREGGDGGLSPPPRQQDKQSTASREGVNSNMEQEKGGKKSQVLQRGPIVHRVSIVLTLLSVCVNIIEPSCMLNPLSNLFICFRRTNHMAINHLHSSSDATSLYVVVMPGTKSIVMDNFSTSGKRLKSAHTQFCYAS
jgi:hypothetical protein